jgi:hypothetical protein
MSFIDNFNTFSLNEDKESRAKNKLEDANDLVKDIEQALKDGNDSKADRLLRKATRKLDKASKLDPSINTEEITNKLVSLKNDETTSDETKSETETGEEKPKDLDVKTSDLRNKIKVDDFKFVNKFKVIGDTISTEEKDNFLKTVKTYLDEYWNDLKKGDIAKEYQSPYTQSNIKVKRQSALNRIVFLYKEGANDKMKFVFNLSDFDKPENKDVIFTEIDTIVGSENIQKELVSNYSKEEDDKKTSGHEVGKNDTLANTNTETSPKEEPKLDTAPTKKEGDAVESLKPNPAFVSQAIKLLIDEKLNIGSTNTDEDAIYNFFVTKNAKNCVVDKNIDDILIGYKKQKSTLKEGWDMIDATKRAFQSVVDTKSKGVVGDLMNAFNSDKATLNRDINNALGKITSAYQKDLNLAISDKSKVKEGVTSSAIKFIGNILLSPTGLNIVSKSASKGALLRGVGMGSRILTVCTNPWFWGPILVAGTAYASYQLWQSFDEQQNQLATIILLMWFSGSKELLAELKQNGIVINTPKIDTSKLKELVNNNELYKEETPVAESKVIKFKDFVNVKDLETRKNYSDYFSRKK